MQHASSGLECSSWVVELVHDMRCHDAAPDWQLTGIARLPSLHSCWEPPASLPTVSLEDNRFLQPVADLRWHRFIDVLHRRPAAPPAARHQRQPGRHGQGQGEDCRCHIVAFPANSAVTDTTHGLSDGAPKMVQLVMCCGEAKLTRFCRAGRRVYLNETSGGICRGCPTSTAK